MLGMNIFIDTNVLLDFYRLSGGDLDELRRVAKLSENGKITLLLSEYLKDEFYRNREGVISLAINQFRKSRTELHLPNLVRVYPDSEELKKVKDEFEKHMKSLTESLLEDIRKSSLKADSVISEVFNSTESTDVSPEIIQRGITRSTLSQPPGKKDSCGDSIHWEWLLEIVPDGQDLTIISGDGDFESSLQEGSISSYLQDEWNKKKGTHCTLYKSLSAFFNEYFPDIRLADEVDKECSIEKLDKSPNFATTHNAIKKLASHDDFSRDEILRLVSAYISNEQIHWILGDEDVHSFAMKLVSLAYAVDLIDEVQPLELMLSKLELEEL